MEDIGRCSQVPVFSYEILLGMLDELKLDVSCTIAAYSMQKKWELPRSALNLTTGVPGKKMCGLMGCSRAQL